MPEAMPPWGGAPIASASSRKPNFDRCSAGEIRSRSKTLACSSGSWMRNEPPASSIAVADEVVGDRRRPAGVAVEQRLALGGRPGEGVVDGVPALELGVPLEHREVGDPEEAPGLGVDQLELAARGGAAARRGRARPSPARRRRREPCGRAARRSARARPARGTWRSASAARRRRRRRGRRGRGRRSGARAPRACSSSPRLSSRGHAQEAHRRRLGEDPEAGAARDLGAPPRSRARSGGRACRSRSGASASA